MASPVSSFQLCVQCPDLSATISALRSESSLLRMRLEAREQDAEEHQEQLTRVLFVRALSTTRTAATADQPDYSMSRMSPWSSTRDLVGLWRQ